MKKSCIWTICAVLLAGSAVAEFRIWTDIKGNSIEAEYVRTVSDKVVLKKQDGSEVRIALDGLSKDDRLFAVLQSPPGIEIKVADNIERDSIGYTGSLREGSQVRAESVKTAVELKQTSPDQYDANLTLEICLVGKNVLDRYVVIRRENSVFKLTKEEKNKFSYTCKPVDLRNVSGNRTAGTEYEGYLVAVRDGRKQLIAVKASRPEFEKHADALLKAARGAVFDKDFEQIRKGKAAADRTKQPSSDPVAP